MVNLSLSLRSFQQSVLWSYWYEPTSLWSPASSTWSSKMLLRRYLAHLASSKTEHPQPTSLCACCCYIRRNTVLMFACILTSSEQYNFSSYSHSLQVPVMIYPEPGLSDQYSIPWWIILIAILAGIILLTLLVCILWKVTYTRTQTCFINGPGALHIDQLCIFLSTVSKVSKQWLCGH